MGLESGSASAREWCARFAHLAEQRESELGHPAPNCPTAAELWRAVEIVNNIDTVPKTSAQQATAYITELEGICDKWLDPEGDPIGVRLHPFLEEVIEGLSRELEVALPQRVEMFREKANLRKLRQTMRKALYLRRLNPHWLNRVWARLSTRRSRSDDKPS
jgi:hypothetical protein